MSILHLQKAQSKPQTSLYLQHSTKPEGRWAPFWNHGILPSEQGHTGPHWHSSSAPGPAISSGASPGILAACFIAWHRHAPRSSLGLWERFSLLESFFKAAGFLSGFIVMLQTFFPGNCSFQTLTLTSLKELALHKPKSLASVKWRQWKDMLKQPCCYTSGKAQLHCLLGNCSNTYWLGFAPRCFS